MSAHPSDLRRELGLFDATMINVGTMIASAIFIVPAIIAHHLLSSSLAIGVWVIGGAVSLLDALCVAELAAAFPEAGGQYVYLREAFGPVWGFLYGWAGFAVINTASIAAIGVAFAIYTGLPGVAPPVAPGELPLRRWRGRAPPDVWCGAGLHVPAVPVQPLRAPGTPVHLGDPAGAVGAAPGS